jgi:hypothetical protein
VKVTCDVTGYPNKPSADAFHELDLFEVDYALTKECDPKDIPVPDPITWTICVENTGDKAIDCTINDPVAGIVDGKVTVPPAGKDCSTTATRLTTSADVPSITNKATAACTVPGYTNQLPDKDATDTCKVGEILELCRTPGFWKTHAGEEKGGKAHNLAQIVIDSTTNDTLGTICGVEINNTSVNGYSGAGSYPGNGDESAVEGMCVHIKTKIVRQLQRQLIAASLNCVVSGGSADCTGVSVGTDWKAANADCATVANGGTVAGGLSPWIEIIDDFNNGEPPFKCTENIEDSPVFDGLNRVPGPAGSSNACNAATYNDFYLVPLTP